MTVHRLEADGTIGDEVAQTGKPDFGIYAHQVRVTPGDKTLTLCSRGNDAAAANRKIPAISKCSVSRTASSPTSRP